MRLNFPLLFLFPVLSILWIAPPVFGGDLNATEWGCEPISGIACSGKSLKEILDALSVEQGMGNHDKAESLLKSIQDCLKNQVQDLEKECKNQPMRLRRKKFLRAIEVAQSFGFESIYSRGAELMKSCKREYTLRGKKTEPVEKGISIYSLNAKVCGYVDDEWEGEEVADYTLLQAHQVYTGRVKFTFQGKGKMGCVFQMATQGKTVANSPSGPYTFPYVGPSQRGEFDGEKKVVVHYEGYGRFDVQAPIEMTATQCEGKNKYEKLF